MNLPLFSWWRARCSSVREQYCSKDYFLLGADKKDVERWLLEASEWKWASKKSRFLFWLRHQLCSFRRRRWTFLADSCHNKIQQLRSHSIVNDMKNEILFMFKRKNDAKWDEKEKFFFAPNRALHTPMWILKLTFKSWRKIQVSVGRTFGSRVLFSPTVDSQIRI